MNIQPSGCTKGRTIFLWVMTSTRILTGSLLEIPTRRPIALEVLMQCQHLLTTRMVTGSGQMTQERVSARLSIYFPAKEMALRIGGRSALLTMKLSEQETKATGHLM